jgi:hypothetical protein
MNKKKYKKYPISKHSSETGWIFVKETEPCTPIDAFKEIRKLAIKDKKFQYRLWDNR